MLLPLKREANDFLLKIIDTLDISDTQYGIAERRYTQLGDYLTREESTLRPYSPTIRPQGSFMLGTVVKPLDVDEFDIDLVCELEMNKQAVSQQYLKDAVGIEVAGYAKSKNFKEEAQEGKRCWTLQYSASANFHMDVLPAIPDKSKMRKMLAMEGFNYTDQTDKAISITDNTRYNYEYIDDNWPVSNPKGYLEWFKEQMLVRFTEGQERLAAAMDVEKVPDYKVKTPLQQAVQLLKRHRDISFKEDMDNKPISIIITTLAGHAYNNEDNIVDSLNSIIAGMPDYIENRNGVAWVENPSNRLENFADKWEYNSTLEENFHNWLKMIQIDFSHAMNAGDLEGFADRLKGKIGSTPVAAALEEFGHTSLGALLAGAFADVGKTVKAWEKPKFAKYPHRQQLAWEHLLTNTVSITGQIEINGQWKDFDSTTRNLPCDNNQLRFTAHTDAVPPYKAHWQTVNTGYEAAKKGDLRGDIREGDGLLGLSHEEHTAYKGRHWIECLIVRDGLILAHSDPFEVHIG